MSIALLAFDLDGTTLSNDHNTISERNVAALLAAARAGVELVPATGRAQGRLPDFLTRIPIRYVITSNGAKLTRFPSGEILYQKTLSFDLAEMLLQRLAPFPLYWELYAGGNCYADTSCESQFYTLPFPPGRLEMIAKNRTVKPNLLRFLRTSGLDIEKLNLPLLLPNQQEPVRALLDTIPGIAVTSSLAQNAEINAAGCDKGAALAHLCALLEIPGERVLALGDNGNDIQMLHFAGTAVVPANAAECAQKTARVLSVTNEEDAVAMAIETYIHI